MLVFVSQCFVFPDGRKLPVLLIALSLFLAGGLLQGQTTTAAVAPDPNVLETPGASSVVVKPEEISPTNVITVPASAGQLVVPAPEPLPSIAIPAHEQVPDPALLRNLTAQAASNASALGALLTLGSVAGFLLFYCGVTRAKNVAHTSMLLLIGVLFGLAGYWIGGFAVQTGGVGDAHAALAQPLAMAQRSALDHELGITTGDHHWGLMGSSGFFLMTDETTRADTAMLFLAQAALLAIAVAAALGAALERGRLLAMAVLSFLIGAVIYPLVANWVWGGGWLAELGRECGLGHGVIDLAGAGVVHETAGTLAFIIALMLGPRYYRFRPERVSIPGHNVPFTILGALVLLIGWTASNVSAYSGEAAPASWNVIGSNAALSAVDVVLSAIGGALFIVVAEGWRKRKPTPVRITRGLLGGAVAMCGDSAFCDAWAALLTGVVAGILIDRTMIWLERRRIDDPAGATAVHGVCGAWGLFSIGLFANGTSGRGMNGVAGPVRGLFFGGAWHQLEAQAIGCATIFLVVFVLGFGSLYLVQKILVNRVKVTDEIEGLDLPQAGALGYQPDVEVEEEEPQ
jgi:Amt family ammonium transporter